MTETLGRHIRAFRLQRGITASELARRSEVSTSLISQVERGISSPSIDVLQRIARALSIHIGALFDGPTPTNAEGGAGEPTRGRAKARLVRANQRKSISLPASKVEYELLSPDLQGRLEFILATYAPGESGPIEGYQHEGEESFHVLRGVCHFHHAGELYVLEPGDTLTFDSSLPHRAENPGAEVLVAISAGTPPSF